MGVKIKNPGLLSWSTACALAVAVLASAVASGIEYSVTEQRVDLTFTADLRFPDGRREFRVILDCRRSTSSILPADRMPQLEAAVGLDLSRERIYFSKSPFQADGEYPLEFRCIEERLVTYYFASGERFAFTNLFADAPLSGLPRRPGGLSFGIGRRYDLAYAPNEVEIHGSLCGAVVCKLPAGAITIAVDVDGAPDGFTVFEVLNANLRGIDGSLRPIPAYRQATRGSYFGVVADNAYYPLGFPNMHPDWRNESLSIPIGDPIDYYFTSSLENETGWLHIRLNPRASAFYARVVDRPAFDEMRD